MYICGLTPGMSYGSGGELLLFEVGSETLSFTGKLPLFVFFSLFLSFISEGLERESDEYF